MIIAKLHYFLYLPYIDEYYVDNFFAPIRPKRIQEKRSQLHACDLL